MTSDDVAEACGVGVVDVSASEKETVLVDERALVR